MAKKTNDITLDEIQKIVEHASAWKVVNSLIEKGLVSVYENLNENYQSKKENYVFITDKYKNEATLKILLDELDRAPKQQNIVLTFLHLDQTEAGVLQKTLLNMADASSAQLKALVDKGIFNIQKIEVDRLLYEYHGELQLNILNEGQEKAYRQVSESFKIHKPVLLKGITGSGKTHIYFKLIEECISKGKQALYLLPEIALTAQIIRKLRAVFGNRIGIYHSRFSNNERVEVWRKIKNKEYDIVIGARSSLFLPFVDLGLIIVDEEHDISYKQHDIAPRYHARDCALYLAFQMKAHIILGSATPSLESYNNAIIGKYTLVELTERYGKASLPHITLIDTKRAIAEKRQQGIFSTSMIEAIQASLMQKKQVILFQNKRGYNPYSMCSSCGWVPQCKYCDVSLTYHKATDQLHCHYCGSKSPYIHICPGCGSNRIIAKSFGTEKVEDDIQRLFPHARVQRFDGDTMRTKNKYNEVIRQFEKGQIDILVGTQMVVKGLDFEHVNLVGVLSADSLLSFPDFRVNERVFQLLEQVAGRAGRKDDIGRVLIQLYNTHHPTILLVQQHNYLQFFHDEMAMRKAFLYPPYTRLIKIIIKHKKQDTTLLAAKQLVQNLQDNPNVVVFGPAEPSIARIRNYYLQEILLKINKDTHIIQTVKEDLKRKIAMLTATKNMSQVQVLIDVDPY